MHLIRWWIRKHPKLRARILTRIIESKLNDQRLSPMEIRTRYNNYIDRGIK